MRRYWYINGECILPTDAINPETGKKYTAGEILQLWPEYGVKRLAVKIHCDEEVPTAV